MIMEELKVLKFCCVVGCKWPEALWLPTTWAGRIDASSSDNPHVTELEWAVSLLVAACTWPCSQSLCSSVWTAAGILSGVCILISSAFIAIKSFILVKWCMSNLWIVMSSHYYISLQFSFTPFVLNILFPPTHTLNTVLSSKCQMPYP